MDFQGWVNKLTTKNEDGLAPLDLLLLRECYRGKKDWKRHSAYITPDRDGVLVKFIPEDE